MNKIWIITKRELNSFFDSLIAYITIVLFLGISGLFTWLFGNNDVFFVGQASLQAFFGIAFWTLFFFIPALTMRQLAEENKMGTLEQLLTKPVSDFQVVAGKFLATMLLIGIALALTIPYYITVASLGNIDHGAVLTGYLGLILLSAAYTAIGLYAGSVTNNQIVAFLLSLAIGILFQILFGAFGSYVGGMLGSVLSFLSLSNHFESMSRGVIDTADIIYFVSLTFLGLLLAETTLSKRNITEG